MNFDVIRIYNYHVLESGKTVTCLRCGRKHNLDGTGNILQDVMCSHTDDIEVITKANGFKNLKGQVFGNWLVQKYVGDRKWVCECLCNKHTVKIVSAYSLTSGKSTSCGQCNKVTVNIGDTFGEWLVIDNVEGDDTKVKCRCTCNRERIVNKYTLVNGTSTSCGKGHDRNSWNVIDLTGQTFGELTVRGYVGDSKWLCECICGNFKIAQRSHLLDGRAHRCKLCSRETFIDLKDKRFGKLVVTRYLGGKKWECQCNCGNVVAVRACNLRNGSTKSCGCSRIEFSSFAENEIAKLFPTAQRCVRDVISPYELDIYVPDEKLAIEYNGTYWHSEQFKSDSYYHQRKTLMCIDKGIRLIHIFEYEWLDDDKRSKILNLIIEKDKSTVYAKDTYIEVVDSKLACAFEDKYHLQKSVNGQSICLGCFNKDNSLLGVMTFGIPRFNKNYQYELLRLCWNDEVKVVGGAEKLYKHFISNYNPSSIISYCNISKFTGKVYERLGFKLIEYSKPNYVWVSNDNKTVLSRYATQKHILIEEGLGIEGQSEKEIMESYGYRRIYDSGNAVYTWENSYKI